MGTDAESQADQAADQPTPRAAPAPERNADEPVLPERSRDDSDEGWGEDGASASGRSDDWYLRERPPHHG